MTYRDARNRTEIEADRRYALLRAASGRLDEFLISAIRKGQTVSKLTAIGDRIKGKKEAHDKKADEWAARLDAIEKREPAAFAIGDAVLAEREVDLTEMEKTMRTLSNLPLAGLDGSS